MKYFISPEQEPKEKLIEENILEIISNNFPNCNIEKIKDEKRIYSFEIIFREDDSFVEILIPKKLDSLVINTNILEDLVEFINEIRKLFSKNEKILLYDEAYSYIVPIPIEGITIDML